MGKVVNLVKKNTVRVSLVMFYQNDHLLLPKVPALEKKKTLKAKWVFLPGLLVYQVYSAWSGTLFTVCTLVYLCTVPGVLQQFYCINITHGTQPLENNCY